MIFSKMQKYDRLTKWNILVNKKTHWQTGDNVPGQDSSDDKNTSAESGHTPCNFPDKYFSKLTLYQFQISQT